MSHKINILPLVLLLGLFAISCDEDPSSSNGVPNNITGRVITIDPLTGSPFDDHSGVKVEIRGTNYLGVTNSEGGYTLHGVAPGIYVLMFSKSGYDSVFIAGLEYSGVGVEFISDVNMYGLLTNASILLHEIVVDKVNSLLGTPHLDSFRVNFLTKIDTVPVIWFDSLGNSFDSVRYVLDTVLNDTIAYVGGKSYQMYQSLTILAGSISGVPQGQFLLRLEDEFNQAVNFSSWESVKVGNSGEFRIVGDAYYIAEGTRQLAKSGPLTAKLQRHVAGGSQVIESNPQPYPRL